MVVGLLWVKGVVVKRVLARERRPGWGEGGWGREEGRERVFLFSMVVGVVVRWDVLSVTGFFLERPCLGFWVR